MVLRKLLLMFVLTLLPVSHCSAVTATEPSQINSVYQISNLGELRWVSTTSSSWASDFEITANIDAADTSTWDGGIGFSPIGNASTNFISIK